ncbi:MAG: PEP-CTERM sorting domain-containing protein [Verrucomicrobiota bacterium]
MRSPGLLVLLLLGWAVPARAVENSGSLDGSNGYFDWDNASQPTADQVGNWATGWGNVPTGDTGWNYVGLLTVPDGYLSGVYLGNGWVLTAAHGGTILDSYTLNGKTYTPVAGSVQTFTTDSDGVAGQADLLMFQLNGDPDLPALSLATSLPVTDLDGTGTNDSNSVIVGYGFPLALESWGSGIIQLTDQPISIESFTSIDYGIFTLNSGVPGSCGNTYNLYPGDSGGANFIYNAATGTWQLAGINEFLETYDDGTPYASGFVQVDNYVTQIDDVMGVPEPSTNVLLALGLAGVAAVCRGSSRRGSPRTPCAGVKSKAPRLLAVVRRLTATVVS